MFLRGREERVREKMGEGRVRERKGEDKEKVGGEEGNDGQ